MSADIIEIGGNTKSGSVCVGLKKKNETWAMDFCSLSRPLEENETAAEAITRIYTELRNITEEIEPRVKQQPQRPIEHHVQIQRNIDNGDLREGDSCPNCNDGILNMYDKFRNLCCSNGFPNGKWSKHGCQYKVMNRQAWKKDGGR